MRHQVSPRLTHPQAPDLRSLTSLTTSQSQSHPRLTCLTTLGSETPETTRRDPGAPSGRSTLERLVIASNAARRRRDSRTVRSPAADSVRTGRCLLGLYPRSEAWTCPDVEVGVQLARGLRTDQVGAR